MKENMLLLVLWNRGVRKVERGFERFGKLEMGNGKSDIVKMANRKMGNWKTGKQRNWKLENWKTEKANVSHSTLNPIYQNNHTKP